MGTRHMRILATLLSLLATLLPAQAGAQQPGELIPTGDPLYDRLQQAVLDEHRAELATGVDFSLLHFNWAWAPALATVQAWGPDFAQRSDYWCLLAYSRAAADGARVLDRSLLERATECQDAGDAVNQLLMRRQLLDIRSDMKLNASAEDAATLALVEAYLERFPGRAWVYYEAADHQARYGLDRRWLELIEAGNSLPAPVASELFPLSFLHERMLSGEEVGNTAVAGSILAMRLTMPDAALTQFIWIKDAYKDMITGGCEGGIERGMTALARRELRCRAATGIPWICCTAQLAGIMPPLLLEALEAWQEEDQPLGFAEYLQDYMDFEGRREGIHGRLQAVDAGLARYLADNPQWSMLRDYAEFPAVPRSMMREVDLQKGLEELLGQLNDHSLYHRYEQEYALNRWLLDSEVPRCREMLIHLASFDYEHPEEYVGMEQAR
ncbi:hypothetical protein KDL44_06830 [bacterium]|nr:hypothetical protein [bacterium]